MTALPPWSLAGEAMATLVPRAGWEVPPPPGVQPVPGPAVLLAVRYDSSPVGPYRELAVGHPARAGTRAGVCITTMAVSSPDSCREGRRHWGLPKEIATLEWSEGGGQRSLRWVERDIEVRGPAAPGWAPLLLPLRGLQGRDGATVVLRGRVGARLGLGVVTVVVPSGDPLRPLHGSRPGILLGRLDLRLAAARQLAA